MIPPPRASGALVIKIVDLSGSKRRFSTAEADLQENSFIEAGHGIAKRRGQHKVVG